MIRARYLNALEYERFQTLPHGPYGRSFLREYAEFLGLDGDILTAQYDLRLGPIEPEPTQPSESDELRRLVADIPARVPLVAGLLLALLIVGAWQLGNPGKPHSAAPPANTPVVQTPPPETANRTIPSSKHLSASHPTLTLTATRGNCWLSVTKAGSQTAVYQGTLSMGRTVRFGLRRPLIVRVGAPWNIDARIGTRLVTPALPAATGNVLVTTKGLRATA